MTAAAAAQPHVVLRLPYQFGYDPGWDLTTGGGRLAWRGWAGERNRARCVIELFRPGGRRRRIRDCGYPRLSYPGSAANPLAATRGGVFEQVVGTSYTESASPLMVLTRRFPHRRALTRGWLNCGLAGCDCDVAETPLGRWVGPYAAGSHVAVYSRWRVVADPEGCDPATGNDSGAGVIAGGRVWIASARGRPRRLAHSGAAALLAVAAGRVAIVPAADRSRYDAVTPSHVVELRDLTAGGLVTRIAESDEIASVSLSGRMLALLIKTPTGWAIDRYNAADGTPLARVALHGQARAGGWTRAGGFAVTGRRVVFVTGRSAARATLRLLDRFGHAHRLALLGPRSGDMHLLGDRIYWYRNAAQRDSARILALRLPRP